MLVPAPESKPDPAGLAKACDGLLGFLAEFTESTGTDTTQLCSLTELLLNIVKVPPGLKPSSSTGSASPSSISIEDALAPLYRSLHSLYEFLQTPNESSDSTNSSTRGHDELDQDAVRTPENHREQVIKLKQTLISTMNTLSLSLTLSRRSQDTVAVHEQVQSVQAKLDSFSKWLFDSAKDIFPPLSVLARDTKLDGPSSNNGLTFTLHEAELATASGRQARTANILVCPLAGLINRDQPDPKSLELKFRCLCENMDHTRQLEYKVLPQRTLLVEGTGPGLDRTWQIFLQKSDAVVSIRLSQVIPEHLNELEAFSSRLATSFARRVYATANNSTPSRSILTYSSQKSVSIRNIETSTSFPGLKILGVQFIVGIGSFVLPWKAGYSKLLHYSTTSKDSLSIARNNGCGENRVFSPESHFILFFSNRSPFSTKFTDTELDLYKILIDRDTVLSDRKGPLYVTLAKVHCIHEGQSSESFECSEVHFQFSADTDAKAFSETIRHMQDRLVKTSLQQAFWGEETVYHQDSETFTPGSDKSPTSHLSVISSTQTKDGKPRYRMIITRNGNSGSVCFDWGPSLFEDVREGLSKSVPNHAVWTLDYNDSGEPTKRRTSWDQLITRGKEKSRGCNPGGTFVKRDDALSSKNWFNQIDDLVTAMKARKKPPETDDKYEPVRIAVIDTGLDPKHGQAGKVKYKDFVDKMDTEERDNTGHGTISVHLILQVYESAELYVARVFKRDEADETKEPYLMAEAIHWAVKQKVDIISISAGFKKDVDELREAVDVAHGAKILIFAAASNWGNLDDVAYPARYKDHVFCIFSTNGALKNAGDYNPEPRSAADNFAVLGEGIDVPQFKEPVRGTSMATAIAAGLAARILDFARQGDCRDEIERVGLVRTKAGMTAIFKAMTRLSGAYECIAPWKLLQTQNPDRQVKRKDVRSNISTALKASS